MERPVAEPTQTQPERPWRSPRARAIWTIILIVVHIVIVAVSITFTLHKIALFQSIQSGQEVTQAQLFSTTTTETAFIGLYFLTTVSVIIPFLMWIHRASKNLASLGVENQQFGPVAAVVWWFVPIASFWMPYRVVAEIWTGSHPQKHPSPPTLLIWWLAWVLLNAFNSIALSIPSDSNDTDINQLILLSRLELVSDLVHIPAALLLIWTVWRITSNQIEKHDAQA